MLFVVLAIGMTLADERRSRAAEREPVGRAVALPVAVGATLV